MRKVYCDKCGNEIIDTHYLDVSLRYSADGISHDEDYELCGTCRDNFKKAVNKIMEDFKNGKESAKEKS